MGRGSSAEQCQCSLHGTLFSLFFFVLPTFHTSMMCRGLLSAMVCPTAPFRGSQSGWKAYVRRGIDVAEAFWRH